MRQSSRFQTFYRHFGLRTSSRWPAAMTPLPRRRKPSLATSPKTRCAWPTFCTIPPRRPDVPFFCGPMAISVWPYVLKALLVHPQNLVCPRRRSNCCFLEARKELAFQPLIHFSSICSKSFTFQNQTSRNTSQEANWLCNVRELVWLFVQGHKPHSLKRQSWSLPLAWHVEISDLRRPPRCCRRWVWRSALICPVLRSWVCRMHFWLWSCLFEPFLSRWTQQGCEATLLAFQSYTSWAGWVGMRVLECANTAKS